MLTVVWNTQNFHIVDVLPKGVTFDTDYYSEKILSEILRVYPVGSNHQLIVHADNAKPHTSKRKEEFMEKNNLKGNAHPPFSPGLIPSDIFLFGSTKGKLQRTGFMENDDFLEEIHEILNVISGKVLKAVFIKWEE
jgi:hypothetical protein